MLERAMVAGAEQWFVAGERVGRLGKPEEIAEGVVRLLSNAGSFVTGHPMAIDGAGSPDERNEA